MVIANDSDNDGTKDLPKAGCPIRGRAGAEPPSSSLGGGRR